MDNSVYLILVPIWNCCASQPFTKPVIIRKFVDWLRYINSVRQSDVQQCKIRCITLINFKELADRHTPQTSEDICGEINAIQKQWMGNTPVHFECDCVCIDVNKVSEIKVLLESTLIDSCLKACKAPSAVSTSIKVVKDQLKVWAKDKLNPKYICSVEDLNDFLSQLVRQRSDLV